MNANPSPEFSVRHDKTRGAFLLEQDGRRIGELSYARLGEDLVVFHHTEVRPEFRGRGMARRLLDAAVAWARETGTRVESTCSYTSAEFRRDASIRDVLAGEPL